MMESFSEIFERCRRIEIKGMTMFIFNSKIRLVKKETKNWLATQSLLRDQVGAMSLGLAQAVESLGLDPCNTKLQQLKADARDKLLEL